MRKGGVRMRFLAEVFLVQLRRTTTHRANWYFSLLAEAIPLLGLLLYLEGIFPSYGLIYGYGRDDLLTYYVVGLVLSSWIPSVWYEVGNNIRTGRLNSYLLRPSSYLGYFEARQIAVNIGYCLLSVLFAAILGLSFPGSMTLPPSIFHAVAFVVSSLCAFQLAYQVGYLAHLSAFWLDDFAGTLSVTYLVQTVLSGQMFPIDFLPDFAGRILSFTPFPYIVYEPLRVYLGVDPRSTYRGILVCLAWIAITGLMTRLVWNAGLKRYDARGG
jgi:ABC-2 type transport system permease protein